MRSDVLEIMGPLHQPQANAQKDLESQCKLLMMAPEVYVLINFSRYPWDNTVYFL